MTVDSKNEKGRYMTVKKNLFASFKANGKQLFPNKPRSLLFRSRRHVNQNGKHLWIQHFILPRIE